jgi:hypothetical protein
MSGRAFPFKTLAFFALAVAVLALAYVEYRRRNPDWKAYQQRGIALAIKSSQTQLAEEKTKEAKQRIATELGALKSRRPEIIEVSPFGGKLPT